jgi:invasion protein IalB
MVRKKRAALSLALGTALASGLLMATAPTAAAASCPSSWEPTVPGAKGKWTLSCKNGALSINGWIEDTRADGRCARLQIETAKGTRETITACGKGTRTNFQKVYRNESSATLLLSAH